MENRSISLFLIGINKENTDTIYKIFNEADCNATITTAEQFVHEPPEFYNADCIIVDWEAWENDLFNIKKSGIRNFLKNETAPLIFIGNQNNEMIITESFKNGADEFIAYPFKTNEAFSRITNQVYLSRRNKILEEEAGMRTTDLVNSNTLLNESVLEYKMILKELQENETLLLTIALNIPNSYLAIIEKNYTIGFAAGQEFKKNNIDPWRLIGLPVEKVFKTQADYVKNYLMKTFEGNEIAFELEFNNQYLLYKVVPLFNRDGDVQRILAVAENITKQKTSERKIKESLQEKETLLKEIHHRVKNNMQLVCSMMNLQVNSIDNSEVYGIFKVLQSRIYSMSLVHEKLYHHKQFSKINFREYVIELVSEINHSFSGDNKEAHVNFELNLQDENFTIEKAIPCGLILNELLLNAFKHASFTSGDGLIRIIFEKTDSGYYRLSVSDNGKGLPEGFDISRTESMGMMLIRELVSQLKGTISVESSIETTFTIIFGQSFNDSEADSSTASVIGDKNILIVEDERIISRMLRHIIEDQGYSIVDAVTSGREAINSAVKYNPDLIIMDIMLEGDVDGIEAAAEIKKTNNCPIVFLTGNSDPSTLKSANGINPFEMLTKPVEKNQLIRIIKSALK